LPIWSEYWSARCNVHSSSVFDAARRQQDTERGFATAYLPPARHADAYFGLLADLER